MAGPFRAGRALICAGTEWENEGQYEFCPTLAALVGPNATMPGHTHRAEILAQIEKVREGERAASDRAEQKLPRNWRDN